MFLELDSLESLDHYIWHEFTNTAEWVVKTAESCMTNPNEIGKTDPILQDSYKEYVQNYKLYKEFYDELILIHKAIKERIAEDEKQRDKIKEAFEILGINTEDNDS